MAREYDGLNRSQISKALNISLPTVDIWVRNGCPHERKGKKYIFSLPEVYKWKKLQDKGEVGSLEIERARLAKEQADKYSLDNAVKRGELVPVGDVTRVWESRIGACRSRLLGLPGRISPHVVACSNVAEVKALLERYIYECLDDLAVGSGVPVCSEDLEEPPTFALVGVGGQVQEIIP